MLGAPPSASSPDEQEAALAVLTRRITQVFADFDVTLGVGPRGGTFAVMHGYTVLDSAGNVATKLHMILDQHKIFQMLDVRCLTCPSSSNSNSP